MDEWRRDTLSEIMMAMTFRRALSMCTTLTVFKVDHWGLGRKQMVHLVG